MVLRRFSVEIRPYGMVFNDVDIRDCTTPRSSTVRPPLHPPIFSVICRVGYPHTKDNKRHLDGEAGGNKAMRGVGLEPIISLENPKGSEGFRRVPE